MMTVNRRRSPASAFRVVPGLLALVLTAGCATAPAPAPRVGAIGAPIESLPVAPEAFMDTVQSAFVLVDLDKNILSFMKGDEVIWEAPVGTGTGLRLQTDDGHWEFSTPTGVFQVKYKEEMPVWYLPDWYFIENDLPIPAKDAPSRRLLNQLGVAAVYLGEEIAIHGTNRPELLGKRVSHGCIRLENKFAMRLYHNVQVGTPIVIVGGEKYANIPPEDAPPAGPARPAAPDPLGGVATQTLLDRLERTLASADTAGAWVPLASRLITRGLKDDAVALRGLLSLAESSRSENLNWEYATFLADAFSRGGLRVVVSLARIEEESRDRATKAIVAATMSLHGGELDDRAPWPTRRFHDGVLGPEGRAGWESLLAAEEEFRAGLRRSASATTGG